MKALPLLFACLLYGAPPLLFAQEEGAVFDSREWDFGAIREADGVVQHAFTVFNDSSRPLRLARAIPGCSCISATLPHDAIAPGQSAPVEVAFTPAGAAGPVIRTVEIQADGNRTLGVLSVSADVLPADRSIQERYPVVLAEGLYASRADIHFGYLERGRASGKVFFIANASDKAMRLSVSGLEGTHFRLVGPAQLAPGEEARVELWCDTPADPELFATLRASLRLVPEGASALREMPVVGLCLTQAPESPDAPRLRSGVLQLRRRFFSRRLRGRLTLSNDGASPLRIHAIELPEGVIISSRAESRDLLIAPGQSLTLKVRGALASEGCSRTGKKASSLRCGNALSAAPSDAAKSKSIEPLRLTVFSNDPLRPAKEIPINLI